MTSSVNRDIKTVLRQAFPLFLIGLTLRPLTTAIGPVIPEIRAEFGMSATSAALLSTLPVVVFGVGAFFVPRLMLKMSPNTALSLSLVVIALGAHIRNLPLEIALFVGTIVLGIGVAIGNVVPSVIARRDFPNNIGTAMGMIVGAISLAPAIAALVTYPLTHTFDSWRWAIEFWSVLPLLVFAVWYSYSRHHTTNATLTVPHNMRALMRNPLAWGLALYFGFQSTNFYSLNSWLPSILRDSGVDPTTAGYLLAILVLIGFPSGLLVPPIAARFRSQVGLCVAFAATFAVGLAGTYVFATTGWWPEGIWLWVVLLGVGLGTSFPLALTLVLLRTEDAESARDLTSFMQGYGYFISALGPLALGAIRDITQSWNMAYLALGLALLIQMLSGIYVSRPVKIQTS